MNIKVKSFTDLVVWKKAHTFVLKVYKITKDFPREEKYGLVNQLRRAVVSISSNIAEGFSRRTSNDKSRFYYDSLASTAEVQNQLLISRDLSYIKADIFNDLAADSIELMKLLNGLIKTAMTKSLDTKY